MTHTDIHVLSQSKRHTINEEERYKYLYKYLWYATKCVCVLYTQYKEKALKSIDSCIL